MRSCGEIKELKNGAGDTGVQVVGRSKMLDIIKGCRIFNGLVLNGCGALGVQYGEYSVVTGEKKGISDSAISRGIQNTPAGHI